MTDGELLPAGLLAVTVALPESGVFGGPPFTVIEEPPDPRPGLPANMLVVTGLPVTVCSCGTLRLADNGEATEGRSGLLAATRFTTAEPAAPPIAYEAEP